MYHIFSYVSIAMCFNAFLMTDATFKAWLTFTYKTKADFSILAGHTHIIREFDHTHLITKMQYHMLVIGFDRMSIRSKLVLLQPIVIFMSFD